MAAAVSQMAMMQLLSGGSLRLDTDNIVCKRGCRPTGITGLLVQSLARLHRHAMAQHA